jgi:hypothetical protein
MPGAYPDAILPTQLRGPPTAVRQIDLEPGFGSDVVGWFFACTPAGEQKLQFR